VGIGPLKAEKEELIQMTANAGCVLLLLDLLNLLFGLELVVNSA